MARDLLGSVLVHDGPGGRTAGVVVEVEAYLGVRDRAAHTFAGRRTPRNEAMWGPGGHAYVYFTYGMHFCVNVVTREAGRPEAVLLRALRPVEGEALMRARRGLAAAAPGWKLARGPGNLCRAMAIDRSANGADLVRGSLRLVAGERPGRGTIATSPRIGVGYAGPDALRPLRFFLAGEPAVSGPLHRPRSGL